MARAWGESLGLFLAPFVVYFGIVALRAGFPSTFGQGQPPRIGGYALAGLAAAALGLILATAYAPRGHGRYIPAHLENGVIAPGRFE